MEYLNDTDLKLRGLRDLRGEVRKELSLAIQSSGTNLANGIGDLKSEADYLCDFIQRAVKKLDNIERKIEEIELPFCSDDIPF